MFNSGEIQHLNPNFTQFLEEYSEDHNTFSTLCSMIFQLWELKFVPSVYWEGAFSMKSSDFGIWSLQFAHKQCGLNFPRMYFFQVPLPKSVWKRRGIDNCSERNLSTTYLYISTNEVTNLYCCIGVITWTHAIFNITINSELLPIYILCVSMAILHRICTNS